MAIDHDLIRSRIRARIESVKELSMRNVSLTAFNSDSALHKFITGANESIRLSNLSNVADAIDVPLSWLIFGDDQPLISEGMLLQMIDDAVDELPPGTPLAEWKRAVAASLHTQIRQLELSGGVQSRQVVKTVHGKGAQSPLPTKPDAPAR